MSHGHRRRPPRRTSSPRSHFPRTTFEAPRAPGLRRHGETRGYRDMIQTTTQALSFPRGLLPPVPTYSFPSPVSKLFHILSLACFHHFFLFCSFRDFAGVHVLLLPLLFSLCLSLLSIFYRSLSHLTLPSFLSGHGLQISGCGWPHFPTADR